MIKSFKCSDTEKLFYRHRVAKFAAFGEVARQKLLILNSICSLEELRSPPGNRLERMKGNRKGQYSIRINRQWRVCFKWIGGVANDVEIVDYHS